MICLGWWASSSTGRSGSAPASAAAWSAWWPGWPGSRSGRVVDASDDELGAVALHHDVPVVQRLPAELAHLVEPGPGLAGLAELLVVPGHVRPGEPGALSAREDRMARTLRTVRSS